MSTVSLFSAAPFRTTSGLNLRAAPTLAGTIRQVLPPHELVHATGNDADGWREVVQARGARKLGWVSARYVEPLPLGEPVWTQWLRAKLGEREIKGPDHNAWILACHAVTGLHARDDETAWCSAAACWAMEAAGWRSPRSAAARDWLGWGLATKPRHGCIVVLNRSSVGPTAGHVGFLDLSGPKPGVVLLLGGNQGDCVSLTWYDHNRVLGYRWPTPD